MNKKLFVFLLLFGGLALAACNTVEGVGQDIESVGKAGRRAM